MKATQVLNMNGGTGNQSYAMNSPIQRKSISIAKPVIEEAIKDVYSRLLPTTLCITDMGCSSGPNTFYITSLLLEAVDKIRKKLGRESPEFHIHLNDLPSNDFNTIFRSLPKFQEDLKELMGSEFGPCFVTGVPGSFFQRLFLLKVYTLFTHLTRCIGYLMLMSKILPRSNLSEAVAKITHIKEAPEGAEGNKGNIYISPTSPPNVAEAYFKQFTKDFSSFLRSRAAELVVGGCMVLTLVGRRPDEQCWAPLNKTFNDMVNEGLIKEEVLESFNLPVYNPSVIELKAEIEKERSFTISRIELVDVHLNVDGREFSTPDSLKNAGLTIARGLRATLEPMLASHFGEDILDELFRRYAETLSDIMSKEDTTCHNVTLYLRKGD